MTKIIGALAHKRRLRHLRSPAVRKRIGAAIFAGAQEIQTEARLLITAGSVSGKGHVPSAPGEPPNRDTGHLDSNIEAVRTGELTSEVESRAEYGLALELGTSKMAERPYMRPATAKKRHRPAELVDKVVTDALKTSLGGSI